MSHGPYELRLEYAKDPRSGYVRKSGIDVFYEAADIPTLPNRSAIGVYRSPGGPLEINPSFVARPQVRLEGRPGSQRVGGEQAAVLNAIEAIRSVGSAASKTGNRPT